MIQSTLVTTDAVSVAESCPSCSKPLVTFRDAAPWCADCEWGLDRYEPLRKPPELGIRWVDRRLHAVAYRLSRQQFARLAGTRVHRPGWSPARIFLATVSVLFSLGTLASLIGGVRLIVDGFPSIRVLPGVLLVLVAIALRPTFGKLSRLDTPIERDEAPTLYALVERVAVAVGAPPPRRLTVSALYNAHANTIGPRQRPVLGLGLPLFCSLSPQQRIALLGHELGHFVNGDLRQNVITQPALTTLGRLAALCAPTRNFGAAGRSLAGVLGVMITNALFSVLRRVLLLGHIVLVWVGMRASQQAEYLADQLAATAAGTDAAVELLDTLTAGDVMMMVIARAARAGGGAQAWQEAVAQTREAATHNSALRRQLSIRDDVSLFATHPPVGLRARMLASRPAQPAAVILTEAESARIDAELAARVERVRRDVAAAGY